MIKEKKICDYVTRGIIEANLNFSKENKSYFSLVKFEYKVDLEDAYSFKDFISFIHIYTDFSPILKQENDSFIFLLKEVKIHKAKATINKLVLQCKNKFDIDIENIGITISSIDDTYKSLMDRIDKYFVMSKISSSNKVFYGTVDFDYYDTLDLSKILKNIFIKSSRINLNNLYRGIPIQEAARAYAFNGEIIRVKIKPDKIPFYQKEKFTFIQHDLIPDIIKANILEIDKNHSIIVLNNLEFLKSSPVERSNIRIQPNQNIHAILTKEHKKLAEGNIASISENSISLKITSKQASNLSVKDFFHKELNIKFILNNGKTLFYPIKLRSYIFNVIDNEIILNISPDNSEITKIRNYISMQKDKLLSALKSELKQKRV